MKKYILPLILVFAFGCKQKKADLAGDAPVKVNDFVAAFPPLALPYAIADTNIASVADTVTISHKVLNQFIPDSILTNLIDDEKKYSIHPIGRIEKEKEIYLLFNVTQSGQTVQIVAVFDRTNKFLAAKNMLSNEPEEDYIHTLTINKEPTFTISKEHVNALTKMIQFTRVGWVYNSAGIFMVVVNDTNEDPKTSNIILNPIDTLPRINKLSGDYEKDKKNFISIRDGKDANAYLFFIHFEKKEGVCTGELKGTMKMSEENTGIYSQGGDPCVIDFNFDGNEITLKEKGSCGNRRGMDCFFDDSFTKKKEAKKIKAKHK